MKSDKRDVSQAQIFFLTGSFIELSDKQTCGTLARHVSDCIPQVFQEKKNHTDDVNVPKTRKQPM